MTIERLLEVTHAGKKAIVKTSKDFLEQLKAHMPMDRVKEDIQRRIRI